MTKLLTKDSDPIIGSRSLHNWMDISFAEKTHISNNLLDFFGIKQTSFSWESLKETRLSWKRIYSKATEYKYWLDVPDEEMILKCLESYRVAIDLSNPKHVLNFAKYFPYILFYVPDMMQKRSFVLQALAIEPYVFPFLNKEFREDGAIFSKATRGKWRNGMKLMKYTSKLRGNKKIMKEALEYYPRAFKYLDTKLKRDKEMIELFKAGTRNTQFSVTDIDGMDNKHKASLIKDKSMLNQGKKIRGIGFNWLKRQPKIIKEDKEIFYICLMNQAAYSPYFFPKFEDLRKHFSSNENYKDYIKIYLFALFSCFGPRLLVDDGKGMIVFIHSPDRKELDNCDFPKREGLLNGKKDPPLLKDLISECLGYEGFSYSQSINYSKAFDRNSFCWSKYRQYNAHLENRGCFCALDELREFIFPEDRYKALGLIKAMTLFYALVDELNNLSLFEYATVLAGIEEISTGEFYSNKTSHIGNSQTQYQSILDKNLERIAFSFQSQKEHSKLLPFFPKHDIQF